MFDFRGIYRHGGIVMVLTDDTVMILDRTDSGEQPNDDGA